MNMDAEEESILLSSQSLARCSVSGFNLCIPRGSHSLGIASPFFAGAPFIKRVAMYFVWKKGSYPLEVDGC